MQFNQEPTNQIISPQITTFNNSDMRVYKTFTFGEGDIWGENGFLFMSVKDFFVTMTPYDTNKNYVTVQYKLTSNVRPHIEETAVGTNYHYPQLDFYFNNSAGGPMTTFSLVVPFDCGQSDKIEYVYGYTPHDVFKDIADCTCAWNFDNFDYVFSC